MITEDTPNPALAGLTKRQITSLIGTDWLGDGAIRLATDLPLAWFADSSVLTNARLVLRRIDDGGPVKLTAKGSFNRRFVDAMVDRIVWPDHDPRELRAYYRVINESDVVVMHYLHLVMGLAGLVRRYKGTARITARGRRLLADEKAWALQAILLDATFNRFNVAYFDRFRFQGSFQSQAGLTLYLIGAHADDWAHPAWLMTMTVIPDPEMLAPRYPDLPAAAFRNRIIRYLLWFGLLESRPMAANDERILEFEVRKSPLFDRSIAFHLPAGNP